MLQISVTMWIYNFVRKIPELLSSANFPNGHCQNGNRRKIIFLDKNLILYRALFVSLPARFQIYDFLFNKENQIVLEVSMILNLSIFTDLIETY